MAFTELYRTLLQRSAFCATVVTLQLGLLSRTDDEAYGILIGNFQRQTALTQQGLAVPKLRTTAIRKKPPPFSMALTVPCGSLLSFPLISSRTHAKEPLPLTIATAGSVSQFLGRHGCSAQVCQDSRRKDKRHSGCGPWAVVWSHLVQKTDTFAHVLFSQFWKIIHV